MNRARIYINRVLCFILFFVPRIITDEVALVSDGNGNYRVYCLKGQECGEERSIIECYGKVKTFTWLGIAAGGKCEIYQGDDE